MLVYNCNGKYNKENKVTVVRLSKNLEQQRWLAFITGSISFTQIEVDFYNWLFRVTKCVYFDDITVLRAASGDNLNYLIDV